MKIEFLVARDNHTWDTVIEDTPWKEGDDPAVIQKWAEHTLAGQARFRDVVLFAVYSYTEDDYETCKRCGTKIHWSGYCTDVTCPYSVRLQNEAFEQIDG